MAIDLQQAYIQKAHRLSLYNVAATVTDVHPGQLFQLNDESEWEYADGTKKAYPTLNSRFAGAGYGDQFERLEGLDDVSRAGKITCLKGNFEIATDQFDDAKTFVVGEALYPGANGQLVPFAGAVTPKPEYIAGFVTVVPSTDHPMLRYEA